MKRKNIEQMEPGVWETEAGEEAKQVETEKLKQRMRSSPIKPETLRKRANKAKRTFGKGNTKVQSISERVDHLNDKRCVLDKINKLQKRVLQICVFDQSNWDDTFERIEKKNVSMTKEVEQALMESRKASQSYAKSLLQELEELSKDIIFSYE